MLPCPLYSRVVTIEKAIEDFTIAFVLQRLKFFFYNQFLDLEGHRDLPGGSSVRSLLPAIPVLAPATFPGGTSVLVRQCSLN